MAQAKIGIIGGSGLYHIEGLNDVQEVNINTPFGDPSDSIVLGNLEGVDLAFLPRHGRGHRINPTDIPVRANIYALKALGVERVISVAAVGSLNGKMEPLHCVIPDQIIDRTKSRINTFFEAGIVAHVGFAEPFCTATSRILLEAAKETAVNVHYGGTYLAMEGPQFSTKAESLLYRSWGADIIGMTAIPEAKLAREAEICYSGLAFITDFDCWNDACEPVTTEIILNNLLQNVKIAKDILKRAVGRFQDSRDCECGSALQSAIATTPGAIPDQVKQDLSLLIGKYIK